MIGGAVVVGRAALLVLAALCAVAAPASAHRRHADSATARVRAAPPDSGAAPTAAPGGRDSPPARFVMPPMGEALLQHPHNKIVHFPVALSLAAALLLLAGRRRPELEAAGAALLWLAAAGAVAAYVTGRMQEEAFHGEPKEWLVAVHERWAVGAAVSVALAAGSTAPRRTRRWAWALALVAAVVVVVAGFYGGMVAHGE